MLAFQKEAAKEPDTLFLYGTRELEGYPLWSPDSRSVGLDIDSKWVQVSPFELKTEEGRFHERPVSIAEGISFQPLSDAGRTLWKRATRTGDRELKTKNGWTIYLTLHETSTSFQLKSPKGKTKTFWATDFDNCYGLSLPPDEKHVAYFCEENGALISDLIALEAQV